MNIYIARHGQTYTNLDKIVCGQYDTKMTELGHEQILKSAIKLSNIKFDYLYSSPLLRSIESAKYFSNIENFINIDEIKEMNTGEYSHLKVEELWKLEPRFKYQGRFQYKRYPNGESLSILYNRISNWLSNSFNNIWKSNENILIVGHEATIVCAIHYFLQIPLENYPAFKISNAGIVKIICDKEDNQFRVEFL